MTNKAIHKYKFYINNDGYISGFESVFDENYDFIGQMGDYPEVLESLTEGWYRFKEGNFVLDEERKSLIISERKSRESDPTWNEVIESQLSYTAMMTDTLIGE